ncbi:MAG: hypothetical protein A2Z64_06350 [Betaproteobacteria bacterium RIFCSPLOWO2_02_67_12]|nr:MAG: hypothetical protein A2Z64_06350 [Betaproteobacteria bacterium RIFCSPLOWO2_02_67_12]OGA58025.1 MAG: hypothetical protein A3F77_15235 [Betaproteobacteria bacterium RIFCSPLOWO2_12_FULL_67_28]
MPRLWRISNHADLTGRGGLRAGGRWHSRGHPVVYTTQHPAAALLEALVHLELDGSERLPRRFRLLEIEAPDALPTGSLRAASLARNWRDDEQRTRALGDAWLRAGRSALLFVPSAIVPRTRNCLLNPLHGDAARLRIVSAVRYPFDARLFR